MSIVCHKNRTTVSVNKSHTKHQLIFIICPSSALVVSCGACSQQRLNDDIHSSQCHITSWLVSFSNYQ